MATIKPRFSVTFSDVSFEKIKKYQKKHNISTQSKAVACLVEIAINEIESDNSVKKLPDTAEAASGEDVTEMFNYLQSSLVSAGLLKEGQDLTDRQADVLVAICQIIRATFND